MNLHEKYLITEAKGFESDEISKWKKAFKGKTIMDVSGTKDYLNIQFRLGNSDETNAYEVVKKGNNYLAKNYYSMRGEDDDLSPDSGEDIKANSFDKLVKLIQKEIKDNK